MAVTLTDYDAGPQTAWCPGCGNFYILRAVKQALVELDLPPHQVLMVSGIGQAGKFPHYLRCNTFNSLHGRTLPPATGAKLVNPELVAIAIGGDGDGYAEGGNHFLHACRRNVDITYIVHNNQVYGLTKGQASPTSDVGWVTRTTPLGVIGAPFNPLALALAAGATFISRGFVQEERHLVDLVKRAIQHPGFALVDVLQPCISFNSRNTYRWYRERVYKLGEDYNPRDRLAAFQKAQEWGERIPLGLLYVEEKPTFESQVPSLQKGPLVRLEADPRRLAPVLAEFF